MNRVSIRCKRDGNAKFYYSSRKMTLETKVVKVTAFILSLIPIILSIAPIPGVNETIVFSTTMVSFGLTLLLEFMSSFVSNHKEKSVLLNQLYETSITDTPFSKIEYDREMTNELNELAIRKGAPKMNKVPEYNVVDVPQEIEDKYGYLYLCRKNSANMYYLMSRMYAIYILWLLVVMAAFTTFAIVKKGETKDFFQLIIQFYPLVLPIVKNINASRKTMRHCAKVSADIDNFFADGDDSVMRRARFLYYVQNIEYEAYMDSPVRYAIFSKIFRKGLRHLENGVTMRFIEAEKELEKKSSMNRSRIIYRDLELQVNDEINNLSKKTTLKKESKTDKKDLTKIAKTIEKAKKEKEKEEAEINDKKAGKKDVKEATTKKAKKEPKESAKKENENSKAKKSAKVDSKKAVEKEPKAKSTKKAESKKEDSKRTTSKKK